MMTIGNKTTQQICISTDFSYKYKSLYVPFYTDYGDHNYLQITDKMNIYSAILLIRLT